MSSERNWDRYSPRSSSNYKWENRDRSNDRDCSFTQRYDGINNNWRNHNRFDSEERNWRSFNTKRRQRSNGSDYEGFTDHDYSVNTVEIALIQLPPKRKIMANSPSAMKPANPTQLVNVRAPPKLLETIRELPETGPIVDLPMTPSPTNPAPVLKPAALGADVKPFDPRDKFYHPNRMIPDLPRRQNPKRNAQRPQRYSETDFKINCITADTDGLAIFNDQIKKREWTTSAEQRAKSVNKSKSSPVIVNSRLWQTLLGCFMLLVVTPLVDSTHIVNSTENLGRIFGPAHECGSAGHHGMTILDTEQLKLAASLDMVNKTVSSMIDNGFGFLVWMHKIIIVGIIAIVIVVPVVVVMRYRSYSNKRKMRVKIKGLPNRVNPAPITNFKR